jgi:hypothetical protein
MKDIEDLDLKTEMDEIMRSVESVMKKVEAIVPSQKEAAEAADSRGASPH